jgi:hypothetical protein
MKTFFEYFKGNKMLNLNFINGKNRNIDPFERKHSNVLPKTYKHKLSVVDRITNGKSNNVLIKGNNLQKVLDAYSLDFEQGIKTLGNSKVSIKMFIDKENNKCGILTRK